MFIFKRWKNSIIFFVFAVFSVSAYFYFNQSQSSLKTKTDLSDTETSEKNSTKDPNAVPLGYKRYDNAWNRFFLFYPEYLSVREYKEENGSFTITFEEKEGGGGRGFQVFILPYEGKTIDKNRFSLDIPSGIIKEPVDIVINGSIPATVFWSTDQILGETREVWFIHKGFLYEITTFAEYDSWLAEIMTYWKFL